MCYASLGNSNGPVAQRLEQGTHNLVFAPRDIFAPSHGCEHERTVMTKTTVVLSIKCQRPGVAVRAGIRSSNIDFLTGRALGIGAWAGA